MIPRFTSQIENSDGAITVGSGNKAVLLKAVNGNATFTDLDEVNQVTGVSADSALKTKTLYEGSEWYGLFTKIHVATGTVIYYQE